jgi:hypothetical protein
MLEIGEEAKEYGKRSSNKHSVNPKFFPELIELKEI